MSEILVKNLEKVVKIKSLETMFGYVVIFPCRYKNFIYIGSIIGVFLLVRELYNRGIRLNARFVHCKIMGCRQCWEQTTKKLPR